MNVNEVVANRGNEIAKEHLLHPNDDVNKSQSSNDTYPTALHIASLIAVEDKVIPAVDTLIETFKKLEEEYKDIVKTGRTHLQDAVPITLGQEISGWRKSLERSRDYISTAKESLREIALGGTAVGTGLNTHKDYAVKVAEEISKKSGHKFVTAENKFHALTIGTKSYLFTEL